MRIFQKVAHEGLCLQLKEPDMLNDRKKVREQVRESRAGVSVNLFELL